jgi:tetratricopeptide (TPR) repeat protein
VFGALARQMEILAARLEQPAEPQARCRRLLAMANGRQGVFAHYLGQPEQSRQLIDRSLAQLREHGDPRELAYFLRRSAMLAREAGKADEAQHLLRESLAVSRLIASQAEAVGALRHLGYVEGEAGEYAAACAYLEEALALDRAGTDALSLGATLNCYGFVRYLAGEVTPALTLLNESLAILEQAGAEAELTAVLDNLGYAYAAAGAMDTARAYFARGLKLAQDRHKLPTALDIILGWTATLDQPEESAWAVAVITYAAEHPAAWLETRDRATRWLSSRASSLWPDAWAAAQARGRTLDYEQVAQAVYGVGVGVPVGAT